MKTAIVAVTAVLLFAVAYSLAPDVARYIKIKSM